MTNYIEDAELAEIIHGHQPDVVMATAITPMIYKSQETLRIVKAVCPTAITIMGGIHPTYMYQEVLGEAPWIDYIIRGEGEEISVNLLRAIANGTDKRDRHEILGIAFLEDGQVVATAAHPPIKNLDTLVADWSLLEWEKYTGLTHCPRKTQCLDDFWGRGAPPKIVQLRKS